MTPNTKTNQQPIAIIGMGGMFAGSKNIKDYWRTLLNGIDCITDPPETHRQLNDYYDADPKRPDHIYCTRGGFLPTVPFDPTEFGIPPAALEATDTSQLLSLLATKMALSDAGYGEDREFDRERTSVILGVTGTQELVISLGSRLGHPLWRKALENKGLNDQQKTSIINDISNSYVPWQENSFPGLLGNVVAGRICNRLNLGGTNCVVDAACASSLSALHLGLMELHTGKSNMVVTGGVDTINDIFMHMCFSKTGVLSHSGDARPFSAEADGTVLGEGIGILVLKRLDDAERDGDRIYALIRGIGSSSDGKSQSIYAPRPEGQARALIEAYRNAGISPDTVDLVEAHGTGTRVGDEMEFTALKSVFGAVNPNGNRCALGSVKSMIGHTKAAAGSAGLIKSALSLYNKVLPPTLKADNPDPKLGVESSPFYLNTTARPWFTNNDHPRRSGVSSFGFGGSNFHVVLEEYRREKKEIAWDGSVEILAFSGPDARTIADDLQKIDSRLEDPVDPSQLSGTARATRTRFSSGHPCRLVMVVDTAGDLRTLKGKFQSAIDLVTAGTSTVLSAEGIYFVASRQPAGKIAFMFPGQGSQYPAMGKDLTCRFPGAMAAVEAFSRQFDQTPSLGEILFPRPSLSDDIQQAEALRRTDVAQPAIGAISLAMLSVLEGFNLRPDATCGHSYGELPALYAAGWIDRETLLHLSVTRGRLMADAGKNGDAGSMLAVKAPVDRLAALAEQVPDVVLANINSPDQGVLSGTTEAIASAKERCAQSEYRTISLPVAAAFHSPLVEGAREPFSRTVGQATFSPTGIPVYANATAAPYPADPSQATDLLARQLTSPVQFQPIIEGLYDAGVRTFVEVGPKAVLCGLVRSTLKNREATVIALDRSSGKNSGIMDLAHAIGHLAALGADLDLTRWENPLPVPRPQKMVVPLSGANYRMPRKTKPSPSPEPAVSVQPTAAERSPAAKPTKTIDKRTPSLDPPMPMNKTVPTTPPSNPIVQQNQIDPAAGANMNEALAIVQKGLESIQSIQQQTARAHQTFLETQAQASRTLQEMMASTRLVVGSVLGTPMPAVAEVRPPAANPGTMTAQPLQTTIPAPSASVTASPVAPVTATPPAERDLPSATQQPSEPVPVNAQPDKASETISPTLISIVSELTGYPEEMLGLEMDIEADLGIDSIKRVEILSAMEERMPQLPQVTPDRVGTLKTLGQICDFLCTDKPSAADAAPPKAAPAAPAADGSQSVQTALISIVSELTGYPEEMLGLEMDIEADLGIDSIKRVEILSAMEERMPQLPQVTPDRVGTLKTLGQICDFLCTDKPSAADAAPPKAAPAAPAADGSQSVQTALISIVSELTGYPEEMLGLEMDIEADLGIDSIKRVEILSAMEERMPQLPQVTPDRVGTLKTLGQICDFLCTDKKQVLDAASVSPSSVNQPQADPAEAIPRQIVDMVSCPKKNGRPFRIEPGRWIGVISDNSAMGKFTVAQLENQQIPARLISPEMVDTASPFTGIAGLMIWGPTDPESAFLAARHAAPELLDASTHGDALFAVITGMDGAFGFTGNAFINPEQGALAGLAKTAALEWESVICRAIDLSPDFSDPDGAARQVLAELLSVSDHDPVEIGLNPDRRVALRPVPAPTVDGSIQMDDRDVVLVTGGARGVTAACALALARATGVSIALVGRSAPPVAVPAWLQGANGEAAMKKAIVQHAFTGTRPTPKTLEAEYRRQLANLSIVENIDALKALNVNVGYFSADVTDRDSLSAAVGAIRNQLGPITGLIHGAGVLHDRLIVDKTVDQFRQVYTTKVDGLKNLLSVTDEDPLRHLILFSSVSARTGNTGQCDYAMANEALNKIARTESLQRPGCRVKSINWGPWAGGMVTPALKKALDDMGIGLIPIETGARLMVAEMLNGDASPVEVLIGSMLTTDPDDGLADAATDDPMVLRERRELDLHRYPVLASHIIGGKPVVPFALISEWIGHGALKENPGFCLHGIDDFRLLSGIRIEQERKLVRVMTGKARKSGDAWHVDVELRNGVKHGKDVIHSRARALLVDRFPDAPVYKGNGKNGKRAYSRALDAVYGTILFHGDQLRAIKAIDDYSEHGLTARLANAPKPEAWMQDPIQEQWMADPMVLDGAFQMAIVWCYEQTGKVCLPSYARAYRQYRPVFPSTGVIAVMNVTTHSHRKIIADFTFLDDDHQVVATLNGYEATVDETLIHAFQKNALPSVITEKQE
jgi:acyl transferase domain-containing protein/NAD(P)-dependent dehydrogenase (short-subunit alcohol dehydrogenase family)